MSTPAGRLRHLARTTGIPHTSPLHVAVPYIDLQETLDQHDALLVALEDLKATVIPEYLRDHPGSYRAIGRMNDAIVKSKREG